ncbi:hypothetical protein P9112_010473 [Eukaryota sp. TZLM1-RC]
MSRSVDPAPVCEGCREVDSFFFCKNCAFSLCKDCTKSIHSHRLFSRHDIITVEEASLNKLQHCKKHPNSTVPELGYFCDACAEPACIDCLQIGSHSDHRKSVVSINDRADEYASSADKMVAKLDEALLSIPASKVFDSIKEQQTNLLNLIYNEYQRLIEQAKESKKHRVQRIQERQFLLFDKVDVSELESLLNHVESDFASLREQFKKAITNIAELSDEKNSSMISDRKDSSISKSNASGLFSNSTVLSSDCPDITSLRFPTSKTPSLLFRASRDGFAASSFHSRCDGQPNVVVLVRATNGAVFGGFSSTAFDSEGGIYYHSPGAFLFRVKNNNYPSPERFDLNGNYDQRAIVRSSGCGPRFGGGSDLYLCDNCNSNNSSYSNCGSTYHGSYQQLTQDKHFTVTDYEVWSI